MYQNEVCCTLHTTVGLPVFAAGLRELACAFPPRTTGPPTPAKLYWSSSGQPTTYAVVSLGCSEELWRYRTQCHHHRPSAVLSPQYCYYHAKTHTNLERHCLPECVMISVYREDRGVYPCVHHVLQFKERLVPFSLPCRAIVQ